MDARRLPLDVSASSMLPGPLGTLVRPIEPALLRLLFPNTLLRSIPAPGTYDNTAVFANALLNNLDIRYEIEPYDLARIPARGRALIVANHPFGFLEGLILLSLLDRVRPDYRIIANGMLGSVPGFAERMIFVDPFQNSADPYENGKHLRKGVEWLHSGGVLVMFPAGEVAHLSWGGERRIADPKWNPAATRLARKIGCPVIPIYFDGANSVPFQMMGTIHPRLRTLNLARELVNKRRRTIRIRIGTAIPAEVLKQYPDAESATEYIRARTYLLMNRSAGVASRPAPIPFHAPYKQSLPPPVSPDLLEREIKSLPADRILASNGGLQVCIGRMSEIPNVVREIGRLREATYRAVGEGTGNAFDLDDFDGYYEQMFLWSPAERRIAGAYRVAATPDVLGRLGIKGLYTSTLFHIDPQLFDRIGPALELGRSFICREYQKHYTPLLLLWKGIACYVQRRPECAVLFGAVSISSEYHPFSRTLIVNYLRSHISSELAGFVRPRRGFRPRPLLPKHVKSLTRLLATTDELSASIQDLEPDGKGVPVLIRQYLKLGGRFLGFNVDPQFSNAIDALIVTDLRSATEGMLDRCMGHAAASEFRAFHRLRGTLAHLN